MPWPWSAEEEGARGGPSCSAWLVGAALAKVTQSHRCEVRASREQGLGTSSALALLRVRPGGGDCPRARTWHGGALGSHCGAFQRAQLKKVSLPQQPRLSDFSGRPGCRRTEAQRLLLAWPCLQLSPLPLLGVQEGEVHLEDKPPRGLAQDSGHPTCNMSVQGSSHVFTVSETGPSQEAKGLSLGPTAPSLGDLSHHFCHLSKGEWHLLAGPGGVSVCFFS